MSKNGKAGRGAEARRLGYLPRSAADAVRAVEVLLGVFPDADRAWLARTARVNSRTVARAVAAWKRSRP